MERMIKIYHYSLYELYRWLGRLQIDTLWNDYSPRLTVEDIFLAHVK